MERRTFIKLGLLAPIFLKLSCKESENLQLLQSSDIAFDYLEVKGSYFEIGRQIGEKISGTLRVILKERENWFNHLKDYAAKEDVRNYSKELLEITNGKYPQFIEELKGMAEGADYSFEDIWLLNIKNEILSFGDEEPGCSTIYYAGGDENILFHNEDGDKAYYGNMLMVKVHPPSGVDFFALLYPGLTAGVAPGFNIKGVCQTTNYIGTTNPQIGIPRYFLGRAVLESRNLSEAVEIATSEPRAHPWHHNLFSFETGIYASVETLPNGKVNVQYPDKGIYIHTNHIIGLQTENYSDEDTKYKNTSSVPRFRALQSLISNTEINDNSYDKIMSFMGSHKNKPYSPCRHPVDDIRGQTLATVTFNFDDKSMRVYKGNPCKSFPENLYTDYSF